MTFRTGSLGLGLAISAALASAACGQTASSSSCKVIDASACISPPPSYKTQVAPLLDRTCNSTCHATGVGPWPLNNHADVFDWASIIAGDIERCSMPPADAGAGNGNLSDPERAMLLDWIACGAPDN